MDGVGVELPPSNAYIAESAGVSVPIDDTVGRRPRCVLSVAQLSEAEREELETRDVPFVGATNWRGGQAATRHLLELGHRRIAMISGLHRTFCRARLSGYFSALAEAALPTTSDLVVKTQLTREHGYTAATGRNGHSSHRTGPGARPR
ncbi:hypothetical protein ACIQB5_24140 [Streptomyces sp. NPDC088560]|uniref:hypothetical protein n=1 Tax=Streptomyces sp. NPDC088560 TaxID=3365868 RepID=UPI0037F2F611